MDFLSGWGTGGGAGGCTMGWTISIEVGKEWSRSVLLWTRFGNSSGGVAISIVKVGVNSAETECKLDFGMTGCIGNMELEEEEGIGTDLEDQCLKGKMDSLKTTSLEKKTGSRSQVIEFVTFCTKRVTKENSFLSSGIKFGPVSR